MIGRIQNKNVSVPVEETFPTETIFPNDHSFVQDPDYGTPRSSLGVANVQDGFEKVNQDDQLQQIGLGTKSIIDPIGYPGEEWLWQEKQ